MKGISKVMRFPFTALFIISLTATAPAWGEVSPPQDELFKIGLTERCPLLVPEAGEFPEIAQFPKEEPIVEEPPTAIPEVTAAADTSAAPLPTNSEKRKRPYFEITGVVDVDYSTYGEPSYDDSDDDPVEIKNKSLLDARLRLYGKYHFDGGDIVAQGYYTAQSNQVVLRDCYASFDLPANSLIKIGQYKSPFGFEQQQSNTKVLTVHKSRGSKNMYLGRDLGIGFEKKSANGIKWQFAVMNGQGTNKADKNAGKNFAARTIIPLGSQVQLGISGEVGTYRLFPEHRDLPVKRIGADIHWNTDKLRLDSEYIYSDGYNGFSDNSTSSSLFSLGVAYTVDKNWDIIGFYDWYDPDLSLSDRNVYNNEVNAEARYVLGCTYYFNRKQVQRLMMNYELHHSTEGVPYSHQGFYMRYSLSF